MPRLLASRVGDFPVLIALVRVVGGPAVLAWTEARYEMHSATRGRSSPGRARDAMCRPSLTDSLCSPGPERAHQGLRHVQAGLLPDAERGPHRMRHQRRVRQWRKFHEPDRRGSPPAPRPGASHIRPKRPDKRHNCSAGPCYRLGLGRPVWRIRSRSKWQRPKGFRCLRITGAVGVYRGVWPAPSTGASDSSSAGASFRSDTNGRLSAERNGRVSVKSSGFMAGLRARQTLGGPTPPRWRPGARGYRGQTVRPAAPEAGTD